MLKLTKPVIINTVIKGSKGKCEYYVKAKIDYGQHTEDRTFWAANLSDWDVILGHPALLANQAIVDIGKNQTTVTGKDGKSYALIPWTGGEPQTKINRKRVTSAATGILDPDRITPYDERIIIQQLAKNLILRDLQYNTTWIQDYGYMLQVMDHHKDNHPSTQTINMYNRAVQKVKDYTNHKEYRTQVHEEHISELESTVSVIMHITKEDKDAIDHWYEILLEKQTEYFSLYNRCPSILNRQITEAFNHLHKLRLHQKEEIKE